MERIKEAVEIAKANRNRRDDAMRQETKARRLDGAAVVRQKAGFGAGGGQLLQLNLERLKSMRIIAGDVSDPRSHAFEMLRTQVLHKMGESRHQTIGITSPTSGCGKTVCALNLALSIARLPEKSITLVDLDLRKPQIASYMGLPSGAGIDSLLRGEGGLHDVPLVPDIGARRFRVFPTFRSSRNAAAQMASSQMRALVQMLRVQDPDGIIVFDLPPMLVVDDVISFLPQLDCILLVVAAGQTTAAEITACERLLGETDVIGIILNKSEEGVEPSYYKYSA
jgi:protein-tyrosine kinase